MKEPSKVKSKEIEDISYQDAENELEAILEEIEEGNTDIDVLSERVKRALFLINLCKTKLRQTDEEVKKLLSGLEDNEDGK
ncbi:MAG: exodeoxyribonuclease VII small subunit [Bacteroidetes bacterium]|nr:exodeoxyribonuclease VII small subunit [Bacteroidota bacterium]